MAETTHVVRSMANRKEIGPDELPADLLKLILDDNDHDHDDTDL